MILTRYLTKETSAALASITAVLLVIFMSNQLVRYLSYAADGRLEIIAIVKLMFLEIPHLLGLLLPLGLYLAVLLVFGRLYVDQEMTAIKACGVSQWRIIRMMMPITVAVMSAVAILNLVVNPAILSFRNQLLEQAGNATTLKTMLPGRFQELSGGQRIVYAGKISPNRQQLHDLFIAELNTDQNIPHWDILVAADGYQQFNKQLKEQYVITENSYRYIGIPGQQDYQIIHYGKYGVKVQNKRALTLTDEDAIPTTVLMRTLTKYPGHWAEFQWRVSLPLMALTLVLLAIPISQLKRGQGKYTRFLPAILIYIIYANMLIASRSWISREVITPYVGMWWTHLTLLFAVGSYYSYEYIHRRTRKNYLMPGNA